MNDLEMPSPAPTSPAPSAAPGAGRVGASVRRIIVYGVLFVLVCLAAGGIADLLSRLIDVGRVLVGNDVSGLALALANTLIAGPLAALLWWFVWRMNGAQRERVAISWALYTATMSTVALVIASTALLQTASSALNGSWEPATLSSGLVWLGVWGWHRLMALNPTKKPLRLIGVSAILGYAYGIAVGAAGAVAALSTLLNTAISNSVEVSIVGDPWWISALQALVWAVGGVAVWWWHWKHDGAQFSRIGLANVVVALVAGFGSVILALGGIASTIFFLLGLSFGTGVGGDSSAQLLQQLAAPLAFTAIGGLIWAYYRTPARSHSAATASATRLVTSGITLAATATGVGIVVNSILAAIATPLVETNARSLLFAGISALAVGGISWWLVWKPSAQRPAAHEAEAGRRIYLIAVFGLSAIVAIITVLVIGFNIFAFALDSVTGGGLLDRVRSELGLLVATGLVAGYHFTLWRRDSAVRRNAPVRSQTIAAVTLVTGSDAERLAGLITDATGAKVTVLLRADAHADADAVTGEISAEQLATTFSGITAVRAIVIIGPTASIEVIPLQS